MAGGSGLLDQPVSAWLRVIWRPRPYSSFIAPTTGAR
jgi:hypothetical protein